MSDSIGSVPETDEDNPFANQFRSHEQTAQREGQGSDSSADESIASQVDTPRLGDNEPYTRDLHWQRLQRFYRDQYVQLLNNTYPYPDDTAEEREQDPLAPTQHGLVIWTPDEKDALYGTLARKGRHDVKALVDSIGTKSDIEVVNYLKLLQTRHNERHLNKDHPHALALSDIPAALQVGSRTEALLDKHAEALCMYQDNVDNALGRQQHPDHWLINLDKAKELETEIRALDDEVTEKQLPIPEAELLRLPNWLELSVNVFMNAAEPRLEENWRNVGFDNETPAMTMDAISEFHELIVSLTRRLMQTSMILAESRLRATSGKTTAFNHKAVVTERDVLSALDIMNMCRNAWKFWHGAPRRCHLKIRYHDRTFYRANTNYDKIEQLLWEKTFTSNRGRSSSVTSATSSAASDPSTSTSISDNEGEDTDAMASRASPSGEDEEPTVAQEHGASSDDSEYSNHVQETTESSENEHNPPTAMKQEPDSASEIDSDPESSHINDLNRQRFHTNTLEKQHHAHADRLDLSQSAAEETRLRHLLRKRGTDIEETEDHIPKSAGPRPTALRKTKDELEVMDWKDRALKRCAREEYGRHDEEKEGDEGEVGEGQSLAKRPKLS